MFNSFGAPPTTPGTRAAIFRVLDALIADASQHDETLAFLGRLEREPLAVSALTLLRAAASPVAAQCTAKVFVDAERDAERATAPARFGAEAHFQSPSRLGSPQYGGGVSPMVHPPPGRGGGAGAHADPNAAQPRRARGVGSDEEDGEVDETPFGLSQQARLNEPVDPDKVEHLGDPRFARAFKLATFSDYFLVDGKQDPLAKHRIVKAKRKDWKEPANLERIPALPEKTKDRLAKALHKDALQDRAMRCWGA